MPSYHLLARLLHWIIATVVLATYISAYYRFTFTLQGEAANWYWLVAHMNLGVAVFVLGIAAFALRFILPRPRPVRLRLWERLGSLAVHYLLYGFLILMPLAAYLGIDFDIPLLNQVYFPRASHLGEFDAWLGASDNLGLTQWFYYFHVESGSELLLPLLLAGHVAAALYHHFALADDTLRQMWSELGEQTPTGSMKP
jgi:cytochrome b561